MLKITDYISKEDIDHVLEFSFNEDFGKAGDITSDVIFGGDNNKETVAILKAKDDGIIAGIELFEMIFKRLNSKAKFIIHKCDGDYIKYDEKILEVHGSIREILKAERLAMNFIGRLSGIATMTNKFVHLVSHTECKVLDTRKTTPGIRFAEKYAVKIGGGVNHRRGLFDEIMIKDNHIDSNSGITECVSLLRNEWGNKYKIIVEVRDFDELKEALNLSVDRIMLDNMSPETMTDIVKYVDGRVELEASGNIKFHNAKAVAESGVDYISSSFITAWAQPLDLSLMIKS